MDESQSVTRETSREFQNTVAPTLLRQDNHFWDFNTNRLIGTVSVEKYGTIIQTSNGLCYPIEFLYSPSAGEFLKIPTDIMVLFRDA